MEYWFEVKRVDGEIRIYYGPTQYKTATIKDVLSLITDLGVMAYDELCEQRDA